MATQGPGSCQTDGEVCLRAPTIAGGARRGRGVPPDHGCGRGGTAGLAGLGCTAFGAKAV
eukprot:6998853-Prorocentrum_lima.AAC.1